MDGGERRTSDAPVPLGHCPACESRDRTAFATVRGLQLRLCQQCGLVYTDPQPRRRVLAKYLREYDLAAHFGAVSERKRVLFESRLQRMPSPRPGANRLCDVGCGDGQFLELARSYGWETYGIELNPPAATEARKRGATVVEGALERLHDLPWESFEVVTAWDAIEHTPEPRAFAGRLADLAVPKGQVFLTTLNRRSLVARLFSTGWSMVVEDHFTYWDAGSLNRLLDAAGLSVVETRFFGVGRDFVRWLDRALAVSEARPGAPRFGGRRDWATLRPVLALERLVNRALDATGAGVGIEIRALKAASGAGVS